MTVIDGIFILFALLLLLTGLLLAILGLIDRYRHKNFISLGIFMIPISIIILRVYITKMF